jgi:phosphoribosyl 1,2-cyclic phosphodiesterase
VRLTFLGVRGSTPAPGPDFVRYGGHTSCVVVAPDAASAPVLALDAGTGLRSLTALLEGASFDGSIMLSHLHWDPVLRRGRP